MTVMWRQWTGSHAGSVIMAGAAVSIQHSRVSERNTSAFWEISRVKKRGEDRPQFHVSCIAQSTTKTSLPSVHETFQSYVAVVQFTQRATIM